MSGCPTRPVEKEVTVKRAQRTAEPGDQCLDQNKRPWKILRIIPNILAGRGWFVVNPTKAIQQCHQGWWDQDTETWRIQVR